jgi:mycothiol synthase
LILPGASLWLMACEDGAPVGALTATAGDEGGSVDLLGVRASHRGRGIGSAMLRHAFATFASRGRLTRAMVNVDAENVTGATGVYEPVGMRVVGRWDMWERPEETGR